MEEFFTNLGGSVCDHTRRFWETRGCEDWAGEQYSEDILIEEYCYVDVDLHRFKCILCNKIFYYSNAARAYFEEGVLSHVDGLDK